MYMKYEKNTDDLHGLLSSADTFWVIETCIFKTPEMLRRVNRQTVTEFRFFILNMKGLRPFETSVSIYQSTKYNIPEDLNLQ
jgi:hypothetical protein